MVRAEQRNLLSRGFTLVELPFGGLQAVSKRKRDAFTLVELLVVIAIIGILVALLLPAIQAAREAARRTQCKNQVKQFITAMHNHVDALKAFPSGGIYPWPDIKDYITPSGSPYTLGEQGLTWAFQVLPYLEEGAVYDIKTTQQIEQTSIPQYFCPSRRSPTQDPLSARYLMDYAAAVPARSRAQLLKVAPSANYDTTYLAPLTGVDDTVGCNRREFWGYSNAPIHRDAFRPAQNVPGYHGFLGVIIRSNRWIYGGVRETGFYSPITFAKISDGSSTTLVIGEKRLIPSLYLTGTWHDDRGWSDGWDPDTLRCTICRIAQDREIRPVGLEIDMAGFGFGSAHPSAMNAAFADASVRTISYDIDQEIFNRMGNRMDDELTNGEGQ